MFSDQHFSRICSKFSSFKAFNMFIICFHFLKIASRSRSRSQSPEDDDNELIYSQQVVMEIKQEVIGSDDMVPHDDDFTIYIDDDSNDNESNNWAEKLSQNQDLVVKKVTESVQNQKRKLTKQIDAIPIAPKKARRTSVAEKKSTKKPIAIDKNDIAMTKNSLDQKPNTSKASVTQNDSNRFVDPIDPFAKKTKNVNKPISFEEALIQPTIPIIPKKKRIAHVPKSNNLRGKKIEPILRLKNGSWPSDSKRNKSNLKVRFKERQLLTIHEYEPNDDEICEILIASPIKPLRSLATDTDDKLNSFENNPLHEIITDITEWRPEWLKQKNVTPPINGVNLIHYPLIDKYPSFEHYKKYVP